LDGSKIARGREFTVPDGARYIRGFNVDGPLAREDRVERAAR